MSNLYRIGFSSLNLAICTLVAIIAEQPLAAQGRIEVVAAINIGSDVNSPLTMRGLPEVAVQLTYFDIMQGLSQSTRHTDQYGFLDLPIGAVMMTAAISLEGTKVHVHKTIVHDPSTMYASIQMNHSAIQILAGLPNAGLITIRADEEFLPNSNIIPYTAEECNAYYHTWWGLHRLQNQFGQIAPTPPVHILFRPTATIPDVKTNWGNDPLLGAGPHIHVFVPGPHQQGFMPTASNPRPRSQTIMAHECGHCVTGILGSSYGYVEEAVADFLAAAITGMPIIGEGIDPSSRPGPTGALVPIMPRDIREVYRWSPVEGEYYRYTRSRSLSGALWQARTTGARSLLETHLIPALSNLHTNQHAMTGDVLLLLSLLLRDDNDGNLTNGTPSSPSLFSAFVGTRGYPWPVQGYAAQVGTGFGGPNSSASPTLRGTSGQHISLHATGLPPQTFGIFGFSFPPGGHLAAVGGPALYLDLPSLVTLGYVTDSLGQATMSYPVPAIVTGTLAAQAAALSSSSALGLAVTNGLHLRYGF